MGPFVGGLYLALFGMALWGIGQVIQDMLLKAAIAGILPEGQRNLAFGLFYTGYGGRLARRQRCGRTALKTSRIAAD